MRPYVLTVLALLPACLFPAATLSAQPNRPAPRVFGNPSNSQYAPSRTYHVENYKVTARIDMAKSEVAGNVLVTLRPLQPGFQTFYIDSAALSIEGVTLEGHSSAPVKFHLDDPKLWITLDHAYAPADTVQVRIAYHGSSAGRPSRESGLSFIRPDAAMPTRPLEVWSYGWPQNNHYWFPCWDYPNDKSTSETVITVPEPLSVVSNGQLMGVTHKDGQATYDWVEHVPHSVYLVSIAVGQWNKYTQMYKSKPVEYYVPPGTDEATALRSFGLTPDMIAFYSQIYGVEYPYEKYAQTADHSFGGGMENISATSLAETTLHDARADKDYPSMDLVSHELGHQWFGDLVTEWGWEDAWLSEGFATFSAALYRGHHLGEDAFRYQVFQDQQTAIREDRTRYRRPIVDRHYAKPWDILDRTTYQKGAAVLDMLRYVMDDGVEKVPSADEPFFKMLQAYLTKYRAANVDTQALIDTIRATTGRELGWFFDEWVFKGGFPEYHVKTTYDSAAKQESITISQAQTVDAVTPLFDMPVHLAFHGPAGELQETTVQVRKQEETFKVSLPFQPLWVTFDPNDHIYKTLAIDESIDALVARGERDPAMMSRLWAAQQLGDLGVADAEDRPAALTALAKMLAEDRFDGVRIASAQSLGKIGDDSAAHALLPALKQPDSHVRTAAVEALAQCKSAASAQSAFIDVLLHDDSYAAQAAAARVLGQLATPEAEAALKESAATKPSTYVMSGVLEGLSHFKDPEANAIITEQSKSGATDELRATATRLLQPGGSTRRAR